MLSKIKIAVEIGEDWTASWEDREDLRRGLFESTHPRWMKISRFAVEIGHMLPGSKEISWR